MSKFKFFNHSPDSFFASNVRCVKIENGINDEQELFRIYSNKLNFPDYFGNNWDALFDCLKNLEFIEEKRVLLIHKDIPFENSKVARLSYLELLSDLLDHWTKYQDHQIEVYFPADCRDLIGQLVGYNLV